MPKRKIKQKTDKKTDIIKAITASLELPKEITLNLPLFSMIGNEELIVENYKGIIEYTSEKVRINTTSGVVKIEGNKLVLTHITSENIAVTGKIQRLEYLI